MLPSPPAEMDYRAVPKRKRSNIEDEEARDSSFQLENLSTSTFLSFEPVSKLLRAHLPLSWLGSTIAAGDYALAAGSILHGNITAIDAWEYSVLVVRHIPNGGLFALEKVDQDIFIAHPLQPFVTDKWIEDAAIEAAPPVTLQMMLHYTPTPQQVQPRDLRRTPSISSDASFRMPKNRRGAAARLSILSQRDRQEVTTPSPLLREVLVQDEDIKEISLSVEPTTLDPQLVRELQTQQDGQATPTTTDHTPQTDMLSADYLRQRYLETLYTTKTSLAYYAKGPLSRARARARASDATRTLLHLPTFYRDSILPAKKMDLKFKDSVRATITQLLASPAADGDLSKKKPSKKTKLGKDGLWPGEIEYITRWWQAMSSSAGSKTDQEIQLKDAITSLRMREAQMQITLILEILSIEAKAVKMPQLESTKPEKVSSNDGEHTLQSSERNTALDKNPHKPTKRRNLQADLDVLADKLCIWHSVGLETTVYASTEAKKHDEEDDRSQDQLRNFCIDVLIPFYSSRLPLLCKSLCKTLAGPELYDQVQKAARPKADPARPIQPGAAVQRRPLSRAATLERASGNEGLCQPSPPAPMRSSTLPSISHFKREPSEIAQRPLSRQTSVSFSSREVDLVADAQVTASKKRKLDLVASQKQELAAAIQVLRKPDRQRASRSFMDEVNLRKSDLKKPVLITATPRANRKKVLDLDGGESTTRCIIAEDLLVPSSTMRPKSESSKKRAVLAAIHDTPSRVASSNSDPLQPLKKPHYGSMEDALHRTNVSAIAATPVKPRSTYTFFTTPTKPTSTISTGQENEFQLTDVAFRTMDRAMNMPAEDSIYDKLGWNEEDDP